MLKGQRVKILTGDFAGKTGEVLWHSEIRQRVKVALYTPAKNFWGNVTNGYWDSGWTFLTLPHCEVQEV